MNLRSLLLASALLLLLPTLAPAAEEALRAALTFHAPFDTQLAADFSRGDPACYVRRGKELAPAVLNDEVRLAPLEGKFGGALHFPRKGATQPLFRGPGVLGYNAQSWSATVSLWLRLSPDEDLQPGYCDPVQIVGDDLKKGFIFLEWSKDEKPRYFRYAIRPLYHLWNPTGAAWADLPFAKRPMVQVANTPFRRDGWTHVAFTLERVNEKPGSARGTLYLNGEPQGHIEGWDLTFGWDPTQVALVLGAAYVGYMDDLAVFQRALSPTEVQQLYRLPRGVAELRQ